MFETSQSTEKLDAALAKAQAEIKPAIKDSQNPHFRSNYADIASVWDAARTAITKHGISVTQWPMEDESGKLKILTRIAHSGEWMRSTFSIPVAKQDAHGYGSATTYARRFTLMAALGIAPDDPEGKDDDGNKASAVPKKIEPKPEPKAAQKPIEKLTEWKAGKAHLEELNTTAQRSKWEGNQVTEYMRKRFNKERLSLFTESEYQDLISTVALTSAADAFHGLAISENPMDFEK